MSDNLYTIQDIQKRTNLKLDFIRRCTSQLKEVLKPHTKNGDFNTLLIDSNGLVIFDKIMQYKQEGLSLPAIKEKLTSSLQNTPKQEEIPYNTLNNTTENLMLHEFLTEIKQSREGFVGLQSQLTKAYETLVEKEKLIENQKHQLLLLTDGRPPEQVKNELINKEVEFRTLQFRSQDLEKVYKEKSEKLETVLSTLQEKDKEIREKEFSLMEQEKLRKQAEDEKEALKKIALEKEEKRKKLIEELNSLDGKWFVANKRKELLKQLQEI